MEIEIGDWRSQLAAAGVKWEIGDRRSEMCEPVARSRSSGPLGALLSSPALDVRLLDCTPSAPSANCSKCACGDPYVA